MLIMLIIPFMRSQDLLSRRFSEALTGRNDNRSTEKYSRREEKKWNTGYIKKTVTKYENGEYGWTTDLETVKRQVDWQLKELKTDYIDYGFIHCLDASSDWRDYQENGILAYLQEMKKTGVVRHIGLSFHTPALAAQEAAPVSVWSFTAAARPRESGISVMKPYSCGTAPQRAGVSVRAGADDIPVYPVCPG